MFEHPEQTDEQFGPTKNRVFFGGRSRTNPKMCKWELNIISKKLIWYSENRFPRKDFRLTEISTPIIVFNHPKSGTALHSYPPQPGHSPPPGPSRSPTPDFKTIPFSSYHVPEFHKFLQVGCFDMSLDCFLKHFISYKKILKYNFQKKPSRNFRKFFVSPTVLVLNIFHLFQQLTSRNSFSSIQKDKVHLTNQRLKTIP